MNCLSNFYQNRICVVDWHDHINSYYHGLISMQRHLKNTLQRFPSSNRLSNLGEFSDFTTIWEFFKKNKIPVFNFNTRIEAWKCRTVTIWVYQVDDYLGKEMKLPMTWRPVLIDCLKAVETFLSKMVELINNRFWIPRPSVTPCKYFSREK